MIISPRFARVQDRAMLVASVVLVALLIAAPLWQ
jgi:hypothetical protein